MNTTIAIFRLFSLVTVLVSTAIGCATPLPRRTIAVVEATDPLETITPKKNNLYRVDVSSLLHLNEWQATARVMDLVSPLCDSGTKAALESLVASQEAFTAMIRCIKSSFVEQVTRPDKATGADGDKRRKLESDEDPDDDILDPSEDMAAA